MYRWSGEIREERRVVVSTKKRCNQGPVNSKKVLHRAQMHRRLRKGAVWLDQGSTMKRVRVAAFVHMPETIGYLTVISGTPLVLNEVCQPLRRTGQDTGDMKCEVKPDNRTDREPMKISKCRTKTGFRNATVCTGCSSFHAGMSTDMFM